MSLGGGPRKQTVLKGVLGSQREVFVRKSKSYRKAGPSLLGSK